MSEVTDSFTGRPVLAKHKAFAFYDPAAFCIAQIAADVPILLIQVRFPLRSIVAPQITADFLKITFFDIVLYWMTGLKATAVAFFTFWFITLIATFAMTAFFRMM